MERHQISKKRNTKVVTKIVGSLPLHISSQWLVYIVPDGAMKTAGRQKPITDFN